MGSLRGIKKLLKKIIIRGSNKYIASRVEAKKYLENLGAESKNIFISIDTVDVNYFRNVSLIYHNNKEYLIRRKKYPEYLLLYVGQLIRRKGIIQILKALNYLRNTEIGLVIQTVSQLPTYTNKKNINKKTNKILILQDLELLCYNINIIAR